MRAIKYAMYSNSDLYMQLIVDALFTFASFVA